MTAAEARSKATEVNTKENNSQYATIKEMIATEVNKGETECWIYNIPIKSDVREKLISEGFFVGPTQSDRNETMTKIKW